MTDVFRPPSLYGSPVIWQYDCKPSGLKMKKLPEILHLGQLLKNGKDRVFYFSAQVQGQVHICLTQAGGVVGQLADLPFSVWQTMLRGAKLTLNLRC
ncbi:hypothetical protein [uncultured Akkermansia sp.]|uniref:hypothetical protein n=3 Tax=uncultured Akkermansia sp. TaxID=512294 RepID=UPI0026228D5A|nr:hypothetical protein [uncultured Akkermansia sp.]